MVAEPAQRVRPMSGKTMWAQQMTAPLRFAKVRAPVKDHTALPGGLLVRVLTGGICGSDLPYVKGLRTNDMTLGLKPQTAPGPGFPMHELVGEVVASTDPEIGVGERVVGWAADFDAMAEYAAVRAGDVIVYDRDLAPVPAIILQPLACVIEALDRVGYVHGKHAAVLGQGPIGLLFSQVLKSRGATVTGVDRLDRSRLAGTFGVDETVCGSADRWAQALGDQDRPQVVVEAIGHQAGTLANAIDAVAPDGIILNYGVPDDAWVPVPLMRAMRKRLSLVTTITKNKKASLDKAAEHLRRHPELADRYVTDVYPADNPRAAFLRALEPDDERVKVCIATG